MTPKRKPKMVKVARLTPAQLDVLKMMVTSQQLIIQAHYGDATVSTGSARVGDSHLRQETLNRLVAGGFVASSPTYPPRSYTRFYVITPAGRAAVEGATK